MTVVYSKLFVILAILIPAIANSAPVNFVALLENKSSERLYMDSLKKLNFYGDRHLANFIENDFSLTEKEDRAIMDYSARPGEYAMYGKTNPIIYRNQLGKAGDLYSGINKLKSPAYTAENGEIYSLVHTEDLYISKGDYVVAHDSPMSFYENDEGIASELSSTLGETQPEIIADTTLFRLRNPTSASPIGLKTADSAMGEMTYNYGSAFRVTDVTTRQVGTGTVADTVFEEVELEEVTGIVNISPNETIFSYNKSSFGKITVEATDSNLPRNFKLPVKFRAVTDPEATINSWDIVDEENMPEGATGGDSTTSAFTKGKDCCIQ